MQNFLCFVNAGNQADKFDLLAIIILFSWCFAQLFKSASSGQCF